MEVGSRPSPTQVAPASVDVTNYFRVLASTSVEVGGGPGSTEVAPAKGWVRVRVRVGLVEAAGSLWYSWKLVQVFRGIRKFMSRYVDGSFHSLT